MPRARQGSAFARGTRLIVQIRLRPDAGRDYWQTPCPPRKDGVAVDLIHAKAVAADLQRRYDAGLWDPLAVQPEEPEEPPAAAPKAVPTVAEFADAWAAGQVYESAPKDRRSLRRYLADSPLGAMPVDAVKPRHVADELARLRTVSSARGGTLAPRTIRNVYDALRRALDEAVLRELLPANPCAPVRGKVPTIVDKSPDARETWICTRAEVWALLTDSRVNAVRRVVYAIEFLTGCRPGEMAALTWRDLDDSTTPLWRLTIRRAVKSVSRRIGQTKTLAVKPVPVHPRLAEVLAAWRDTGWTAFVGRAPTPSDLIVPNQAGTPRSVQRGNRDFKRDLAKLGFRERHHYCTRHTFITLTQDDGGAPDVLRWITHAPPRGAYEGYTRGQWGRLCEELARLRINPGE
jgi:integrase